ncbi:transporter substrate-binding domain-containing protein [Nordella sp. HKS 07]|uniref:transporter substrate-binding domain-containing protein n=1 Tax=Nordella sp. HKS 07 TaxID=2712222 RepID=UPI0013E199E1|nr:transporter substrate-binding domain-containing protein [Nordella sp. HKS 07]QIG50182.1 transporter substrate-binding domain-containing protein [Nordella sp. HKS 07]
MRKVFERLVLAAGLVVLQVGLAHADIKIGLVAEPYPPFTSKDASGKWVGWEIDVLEAACKAMNEKCEYVEIAWDGLIPSLNSRTIDVIWSSLSITADRLEVIDFSVPYYSSVMFIVGPKNGDLDISPEHLAGKVIGVPGGGPEEKYATVIYAPAGTQIKTYPTQDETSADLVSGRIDYTVGGAAAMQRLLVTAEGSACCEHKADVDDPKIVGEGMGAGIRKGDTALKAKLDAAIAALAKSGELDRITANHPELKGTIKTPKP